MTGVDPAGWADLLTNVGLLGGALIIIALLVREDLIPKGRLAETRADKSEAITGWKEATKATETAAQAISKLVDQSADIKDTTEDVEKALERNTAALERVVERLDRLERAQAGQGK